MCMGFVVYCCVSIMKKIKGYCILCVFLCLIFWNCRENSSGPTISHIQLQAEDVGVTDALVRLKALTTADTVAISVTLGSKILYHQVTASSLDTVFQIDSLLPNQKYSLTARRDRAFPYINETTGLTITTMDTTSHNFTWETDTLGDGNNSTLFDVAIVNDTCAYAVGELYKRDSTGRWNTDPYNLASWNGHKWTLKQIYYLYQGQYFIARFTSVFAFSSTDIWVGSNQPQHWNGNEWEEFDVGSDVWNGWINKIWGTSSSNVYMVGAKGAIMHFDGTRWQKMESGTDVDLTDVWGSPDGSIVWACGYYRSRYGTYLLRYSGTNWKTVYDGTQGEFQIRADSLSGAYTGVYTPNAKRIYVGSSAGIYAAYSTTKGEARRLSFTSSYFPGFPNAMRGNGENDLTIVGDYNFVAHYNGHDWRYFSDLKSDIGRLWSVDCKGTMVVAVGYSYDPINSRGIVMIGRR